MCTKSSKKKQQANKRHTFCSYNLDLLFITDTSNNHLPFSGIPRAGTPLELLKKN